ncbi:MAG: DUF6383 domain-containing protein [Parabacteroides sp.]|nr:DUF6383 domain-containing protein [Parabacteroides sp.]
MNKKFSTLVAGLLLAGTVGANAANYSKYPGAWTNTANWQEAGYPVKMAENKYFHLAVNTTFTSGVDAAGVLAVEQNASGAYTLKVVTTAGAADLRQTLWTVEFLKNAEGGYSYRLKNVFANMYLSVSSKGAYILDKATGTISNSVLNGDVYDWKWVPAPDPKAGFGGIGTTANANQAESIAPLSASFGAARDSIVSLYSNTAGDVVAIKYAANNSAATASAALTGYNKIQLTPALVKPLVLTQDDLNSMLWAQNPTDGKLTLSFNKDVEGGNPAAVNYFTKTYKAVAAKGYPANVWGTFANAGAAQSVNLAKLADYEQYKSFYDVAASFVSLLGDNNGVINATNLTNIQAVMSEAATKTVAATLSVEDKAKYIAAVADLKKKYTEEALNGTITESVAKLKIATVDALVQLIKANVSNETTTSGVEAWSNTKPNTILTSTAYLNVTATSTTKAVQRALQDMKRVLDDKKDLMEDEKENSFDIEAKKNGWVSLEFNKDEKQYLMLDTAYLTADAGKKHAAFALKDWSDMNANSYFNLPAEDVVRKDINGRHNYQFTYYPSQDSVVIRTAGYLVKDLDPDNAGTASWKDMQFAAALTGTQLPAATNLASTDEYGSERNLVKVVVLTNNHREVTVGNTEYAARKTPARTVNTWISFHGNLTKVRTTLESGLYFFNLATDLADRQSINGSYFIADFAGINNIWANEEQSQLLGTVQDFGHMPRTQWVVEQNLGVAGEQTVNIYNREFPHIKAENVQLYKGGDGKVFADYITLWDSSDTLAVNKVMTVKPDSKADKDEYLGYNTIITTPVKPLNEMTFVLNYLSGIENGHYVNVSSTEKDTTIYVNLDDEKVVVELELPDGSASTNKYGYTGKVVPQLYRTAYILKIHDSSKLANNNKYVRYDDTQNIYVATASKDKAAQFFLKENNQVVDEEGNVTCYYALQNATRVTALITGAVSYPQYKTTTITYDLTAGRVGVKDASLAFSKETNSEVRVATFALEANKAPLYRRLGETIEDGLKDNDTNIAKIYRINSTEKEYLYEDALSKYSVGKGINFLGVEGKGDAKNGAMFVDTAYVRGETNMPQYMLAVDVTKVEAGKECPIDPEHNTPEYLAAHPEGCPHAVATEPYVIGRYLINAEDSVQLSKNGKNYLSDTRYTRLAFVWAKHIGDTLVILNNNRPATIADSIFLGDNDHNKKIDKKLKDAASKVDSMKYAHKNGIKNAVFAFRLINDEPEANFLIETAGDQKVPSDGAGKWIAVKNGVPVVAAFATYKDAVTDAERFNIEGTTDAPTANEAVEAAEVSVVATQGAIIVKGAAGKVVTVANILGQTIANQVAASDNVTIAAPAGIAVVTVDGEATKVVVK